MDEADFPFTKQSITSSMLDALALAALYSHTDRCRTLWERVSEHCSANALHDSMAFIAPTSFTEKHFDVSEEARGSALIMPCLDELGDLEDLVAFELGDPFRIRTFLGDAVCVGLSEIFEARHHPQFRVQISSGIWPFLKSGCRGLLPINWRQTALYLQERRVGGLVASDREDAEIIETRLKEALPEIPLFVSTAALVEVAA